ncbi:hypothetical protein TPHA_0J01390 [Tetrapisispora phaffii CBS 4417]|uniref:PX domain-containing protein n=1 Tax=Tetrapisispora phaffii (strain ATCC 24235 / CBS 4417 / NBRC 1672 / NRRL Y-8282 / UCD 70-5) TaxID=1071381 RepID=G8BYL9_TETPH|nr:hypothetical protein TPHA_0J01390 [Tetrapisispora phaffii CBS 4417]CCE64961.1 hypothetical protein TPHA_0J01390 [Tetrapisispora phaffii CBS 4417]
MPNYSHDDLTKSVWDDEVIEKDSIEYKYKNFANINESPQSNMIYSELADTLNVLDIKHDPDPENSSVKLESNPFEQIFETKVETVVDNSRTQNINIWGDPFKMNTQDSAKVFDYDTAMSTLTEINDDEGTIYEQTVTNNGLRSDGLLFSNVSPVKLGIKENSDKPEEIISPTKQSIKGKLLYKNKRIPRKTEVNSIPTFDPLSIMHAASTSLPDKLNETTSGKQSFNQASIKNLKGSLVNNDTIEIDESNTESENAATIGNTLKDLNPLKPFTIKVTNPEKTSDLGSTYIKYCITSESELLENTTVEVFRRYSDIRWLYRQLQYNHWGKIIPVPPEKQVIGRFEQHFIESRRKQIEIMLNKIANDPELQNDTTFHMFLTSIDIVNERRNMEIETGSNASNDSNNLSEVHIGEVKLLGKEDGLEVIRQGGLDKNYKPSLINLSFNVAPKYNETNEYFKRCKERFSNTELKLEKLINELEKIILENANTVESIHQFTKMISTFIPEDDSDFSELLRNFQEVNKDICKVSSYFNNTSVSELMFELIAYKQSLSSANAILNQRNQIGYFIVILNKELKKVEDNIRSLKNSSLTTDDNPRIQELNAKKSLTTTRLNKIKRHFINLEKISKTEIRAFDMMYATENMDKITTYIELSIGCQQKVIELWQTFYKNNL